MGAWVVESSGWGTRRNRWVRPSVSRTRRRVIVKQPRGSPTLSSTCVVSSSGSIGAPAQLPGATGAGAAAVASSSSAASESVRSWHQRFPVVSCSQPVTYSAMVSPQWAQWSPPSIIAAVRLRSSSSRSSGEPLTVRLSMVGPFVGPAPTRGPGGGWGGSADQVAVVVQVELHLGGEVGQCGGLVLAVAVGGRAAVAAGLVGGAALGGEHHAGLAAVGLDGRHALGGGHVVGEGDDLGVANE